MNEFFDNFKRFAKVLLTPIIDLINLIKFLATPKGIDLLITIIIAWALIFGVIVFLIEILT